MHKIELMDLKLIFIGSSKRPHYCIPRTLVGSTIGIYINLLHSLENCGYLCENYYMFKRFFRFRNNDTYFKVYNRQEYQLPSDIQEKGIL